jgi:hypothetical protein
MGTGRRKNNGGNLPVVSQQPIVSKGELWHNPAIERHYKNGI